MKDLAARNPKLKAKLDGKAERRWKAALRRFSKIDELHNDRISVFGK